MDLKKLMEGSDPSCSNPAKSKTTNREHYDKIRRSSPGQGHALWALTCPNMSGVLHMNERQSWVPNTIVKVLTESYQVQVPYWVPGDAGKLPKFDDLGSLLHSAERLSTDVTVRKLQYRVDTVIRVSTQGKRHNSYQFTSILLLLHLFLS